MAVSDRPGRSFPSAITRRLRFPLRTGNAARDQEA
jgi:hypothetical protein